MARKEGGRSVNTVWIFCEGEKTEKYYFQRLKAKLRIGFNVKINTSGDKNASGVINYALSYKKNRPRDFLEGDLIYCVFDRNGNSNNELQKAQKLARENGIIIVFSNPCFEYWILTHFGYFPSSYESNEIVTKLNELLNTYQKNDKDIYDKTADKINEAIKNAKRITTDSLQKNSSLLCRESNPSTQVYLLIEKFNELKRDN